MMKKCGEIIEKSIECYGLLGTWAIAGIAGYISALGFSTLLEFIIKLIKRIWK